MESISLGNQTFYNSLNTIIESMKDEGYMIISIDLPSLESINLGASAIHGISNLSNSILMQSNSYLQFNN